LGASLSSNEFTTGTTTGSGSSGKPNVKSSNKKQKKVKALCIIGPSNSGKTALFQYLYTKEVRDTVSSVDENTTTDSEDSSKISGKEMRIGAIDIPGHYNFRSKINECVSTTKGIILVIDSKDKSKFSEASEILYDVINNNSVLENRTPILIFCNKSDLQFSRKATQIEAELEKEIEEIRKVRKATMDDQDTAKENVSEMGFLES
jgi:small GTP-binding protein